MYEKLREYINESNNIVFFGGAGVSTESGIPDFRSKDGLYNQHDIQFDQYKPEYLLSRNCLYNNPKVFYEFYRQKLDTRNVEPNITHKVLAKMEADGKVNAIVTQNIDGLHQKAGSKNVLEIHGTTQINYCSKCGKTYPADFLYESSTHEAKASWCACFGELGLNDEAKASRFEPNLSLSKDSIPKCECGGLIRPDVTLYGEGLPKAAVSGALEAISKADMLIVGGTSLQVYPAAQFITYFQGNHLVVINKEKLDIMLNPETDLMITDSLGNVFQEINQWL